MERFGLVVPAYNEEETIQICLNHLQSFRAAGDRIIVVDAGSSDATGEKAERDGVEIVRAETPARGWAAAAGVNELLKTGERFEAILIVHADTLLPPDARQKLMEALQANPFCAGGSFGHRIEGSGWKFRLLEWGNRLRAKHWQIPYGDQAQFFRPDKLTSVGGFPNQEAMEDMELSLRMRRTGGAIYLDCPALIPRRHWKKGVARTTLRNWRKALAYIWKRSVATLPHKIAGEEIAANAGKSNHQAK
ncbi:MAG: glycosyltransferase [Candidatus Omnitrophota bacterium]